jgi:two-component system chemotaxis response regulator CheB
MKVLIADHDPASALTLERFLGEAGHDVVVTHDGAAALQALGLDPFDALLTDWMMPRMDGIELIRRVRATIKPLPVIVVFASLSSSEARARALDAGADDYLARPCPPKDVLILLESCLARRAQPRPGPSVLPHLASSPGRPPFVGVVAAASTGGPHAITSLLSSLPALPRAALFVVLHGPSWMLETFAARIPKEAAMPVHLVRKERIAEPGQIFLAPGDRHMTIEPGSLKIRLLDDPPINFVRPAADPLFISAARAFGERCVAVVLTGMGRDGAAGCEHVAAAGGVVLVQDPAEAVARSMPQTVIEMGLAKSVMPLKKLPKEIARIVEEILAAVN